ncbi:hypothetical protein [Thauera sp. SDU_THAU2]|uniref:hypothetical protein n=1 Tax=Thauera sp. SDU_THAU2 TaxID=3136633 RepID=UPI00311F255A
MLFNSTTSRNIFAVAACGLVATIAASAVLFYRSYEDVRATSLDRMRQIAKAEALVSEKRIGGTVHIIDGLGAVLETMKADGEPDRGRADRVLHHMLERSPDILALWTGWEPNAFDGRDADFVDAKGYDSIGALRALFRSRRRRQDIQHRAHRLCGARPGRLLPAALHAAEDRRHRALSLCPSTARTC